MQHMISARAHGAEDLDWTALVAGQRLSAGLEPFHGKVSNHPFFVLFRPWTRCWSLFLLLRQTYQLQI
jgi:hypothetical protein